jgi:hypothetical protein
MVHAAMECDYLRLCSGMNEDEFFRRGICASELSREALWGKRPARPRPP